MKSHQKKYLPRSLEKFTFALIILFEAGQQHFFVEAFNLVPEEGIDFIQFVKGQIVSWSIWLISTIPLGRYLNMYPPKLENLNYRIPQISIGIDIGDALHLNYDQYCSNDHS